jgi:hypothetical protein
MNPIKFIIWMGKRSWEPLSYRNELDYDLVTTLCRIGVLGLFAVIIPVAFGLLVLSKYW